MSNVKQKSFLAINFFEKKKSTIIWFFSGGLRSELMKGHFSLKIFSQSQFKKKLINLPKPTYKSKTEVFFEPQKAKLASGVQVNIQVRCMRILNTGIPNRRMLIQEVTWLRRHAWIWREPERLEVFVLHADQTLRIILIGGLKSVLVESKSKAKYYLAVFQKCFVI
jgi:hypothetical protein